MFFSSNGCFRCGHGRGEPDAQTQELLTRLDASFRGHRATRMIQGGMTWLEVQEVLENEAPPPKN